MCGDWPRASIFASWPAPVAEELATFVWPIRTESELRRLFLCVAAQPVSVCGGEFTAATRSENERAHGEVTISVDFRESLVPGVHACMDMRLVLEMRSLTSGRDPWLHAYIYPPCTHQTLSDTTGYNAKRADGRLFWGILFVIWCWCVHALMLLVEQPKTRVSSLFMLPTQEIETSQLGDKYNKTLCLYERGRAPVVLMHPVGGISAHGNLRDFEDADARDRWRSSWERFPWAAFFLVAALHDGSVLLTPDFPTLREAFAVRCFEEGIFVPADYENALAQPISQIDRDYQFVRGKGHGRRPKTTVPRSLRELPALSTEVSSSMLVTQALEDRRVDLRHVNPDVIILCFVIMHQSAPLILAMLNGMEVVGADLRQTTHRSVGLAVATRWAEHAIGAASSTFLVGEYQDGARLFTAPVNLDPDATHIVRTPAQRKRRLKMGFGLAWCTLAALAGTIGYDPAARAAAACSALCGPVGYFEDSSICGHALLTSFSIGAFRSRPLVDTPQGLPVRSTTPDLALRQSWASARVLQEHIAREVDDPDLLFWGQAIKPLGCRMCLTISWTSCPLLRMLVLTCWRSLLSTYLPSWISYCRGQISCLPLWANVRGGPLILCRQTSPHALRRTSLLTSPTWFACAILASTAYANRLANWSWGGTSYTLGHNTTSGTSGSRRGNADFLWTTELRFSPR